MSLLIERLRAFVSQPESQPIEYFLHEHRDAVTADIRLFIRQVGSAIEESPEFGQQLRMASESSGNTRITWKNCVGNQVVQPLLYERPATLDDIKKLIVNAEHLGCRVRAIGSGHSFSDVVQTTDILVDTHELKGQIPLNTSVLKDGIDTTGVVHFECGITIHDLNNQLEAQGLALANMGGYDAQTLIGAIATGTHGSGITLGPLASCLRSIVLVGDGGHVYRIEPANGMTDPARYASAYPSNTLVQDDSWFNTVAVSMGCTGVIYSAIIQTVPSYWLKEERYISDWHTVRAQLAEGGILYENRHLEVLVNPYSTLPDGNHRCLVTKRNIVPRPVFLPPDKTHRNYFAELLGDLFGELPGLESVLVAIFNTYYAHIPQFIDESLNSLVDDGYTNISYKVLNLGSANNIKAYSAEIGFPMCDNVYLDAVEGILAMASRMRDIGQVYMTSPFSLRFVAASSAYLAMMHGVDTCMIEMPTLDGTQAGYEILRRYEAEMYRFSGRPHWGQVNHLTGSNDFIAALYPELNTWLAVHRQLNARGTFSNAFSDRVGFSSYDFNTACR